MIHANCSLSSSPGKRGNPEKTCQSRVSTATVYDYACQCRVHIEYSRDSTCQLRHHTEGLQQQQPANIENDFITVYQIGTDRITNRLVLGVTMSVFVAVDQFVHETVEYVRLVI